MPHLTAAELVKAFFIFWYGLVIAAVLFFINADRIFKAIEKYNKVFRTSVAQAVADGYLAAGATVEADPDWLVRARANCTASFNAWFTLNTNVTSIAVHPQALDWVRTVWLADRAKQQHYTYLYKAPDGVCYVDCMLRGRKKPRLIKKLNGYRVTKSFQHAHYATMPADCVYRIIGRPRIDNWVQLLDPILRYLATAEALKINNLLRVSVADMDLRIAEYDRVLLARALDVDRRTAVPEKTFLFGGEEYGVYRLVDRPAFLAEGQLQRHCLGTHGYYERSLLTAERFYSVRATGALRSDLTLTVDFDTYNVTPACVTAQTFANGFAACGVYTAQLLFAACAAMDWTVAVDQSWPAGFNPADPFSTAGGN
jgi:hypothetical protein